MRYLKSLLHYSELVSQFIDTVSFKLLKDVTPRVPFYFHLLLHPVVAHVQTACVVAIKIQNKLIFLFTFIESQLP